MDDKAYEEERIVGEDEDSNVAPPQTECLRGWIVLLGCVMIAITNMGYEFRYVSSRISLIVVSTVSVWLKELFKAITPEVRTDPPRKASSRSLADFWPL